ncbi:lysophospholipid acyltransferase family protein [Desulfobacter sp.]
MNESLDMAILKLIMAYVLYPIAGRLPHSLLMRLAELAGYLLMYGKSAEIMKTEVGKMLGPEHSKKRIHDIVLRAVQNNQKDLFEIWSFPIMNKDKLAKIAYFSSIAPIDKALAAGKGVVIGVSHFGSWKIIIAALAYEGYPTYQIAVDPLTFCDPSKKRYQNRIMEIERYCEDSLPAHFLYVGKFMRKLFKAFKENAIILNSFDGLMKKNQEEIKLLNTIIPVDKSAILLAQKFDAPIVPIFAVRQNNDRHRLVVHNPIYIDSSLEQEQAVEKAFNQYMTLFKKHVIENPSHYVRILYQLAKDKYKTDAPRTDM